MHENVIREFLETMDPEETQEWLEALEDVMHRGGFRRARNLLVYLQNYAIERGVDLPFTANTPYVNTIHVSEQPAFPGNREIERRVKSMVRWNAMAMVHRANKKNPGIGGHMATYQSAATLLEVGFNHFFRGKGDDYSGDQIYFQGHASPGVYSRAFLLGRLSEQNLENFRRELEEGGGLSSYPHPWLMPNFWEFPTVSMGLAPIMAIYQARFNRYLEDRGLKDTSKSKVWAFLGDGECDEPETLGAITLASRESLDNLIFVINCNLQRLDGPVRGNGKIIQELEAAFRGAGWNVIKVLWGSDWDPLFEKDSKGLLARALGEMVDGQAQKYADSSGAYIREHFFGQHPELLKMVENMTDDQLRKLSRGGHDPEKVYAAYRAAFDHKGAPSVVLCQTIKGYGMGQSGEAKNIAHQQKKMALDSLRGFRDRFGIPISDEQLEQVPFYKPAEDTQEMQYLLRRRRELGGFVPARSTMAKALQTPPLEAFPIDTREASTTMSFVRMFTKLLGDKALGKLIVPIVPDEARTFGMEALYPKIGIYAHNGQLYEPVDRDTLLYYKEAKDGQILEEGITESGSMSSFIAAGTAYQTHGINTIPFYIFYSMFGFQRVGDLIWAAADCRAKGFLLGATAGRTTLNGEGLQHQDGHSHLAATTVPSVLAYDPAFSYEIALIVRDGIRRMYEAQEDVFYYITLYNENYQQPEMPASVEEGVLKGLYKYKSQDVKKAAGRVQLFGSGPLLPRVLEAQRILAEQYNVASDVWSVTSYKELRREAQECERWNRLHPTATAKQKKVSYLEQTLNGVEGPFVAVSDYVKLVAEQIRPWIPGRYCTLGADGFGRSDTRASLRRHFEIDKEFITVAALSELLHEGKIEAKSVAKAIKDLGIDPDKINPVAA